MNEWTIHGGRRSSAQQAFPNAPTPWLDLSTGINPEFWPGINQIGIDWRGLPEEQELRNLELAAARYFGARAAEVCALPGTEPGLRTLRHLGLPSPFRHLSPGYKTHGEAFPGTHPIGRHSLFNETMKGGTILLANPANPDGQLMQPEELLALARQLSGRGGWLIVDEAFIDAHPDASIIPWLTGGEQVIVLRSFGKFFGLAGVRLGFTVATSAIIADWRKMLGSWPLSSAAIAIGTAAYSDLAWISGMRDTVRRRADAMDGVLRRHGLEPLGDCPLFRLVECEAPALFKRLARRGILTRPFDYAPRWLRLGVPIGDADLMRLDIGLAGG